MIMGFFSGKNHSAGYARDRMKLLLVSERIDCSPQMMKLLRNDLIHAVKKYVVIEELYRSDYFVDKSLIIERLNKLIGKRSKYLCITRPRRFGKTSVADMIGAY